MPLTQSPARVSFKTVCLNRVRDVLRLPVAEKLVARATAGRPFNSLIGKLVPNHYQYPKPAYREVVRHGIRFRLDIADLVDWAVYFDFNEKSLETLFRLAEPGFTVFDVGANIGNTVLRMAQNVGETGRVIGFEPDPVTYENCRRNVGLNSFRNVTLEQLALGAEKGTLSLQRVAPRNPGMNRLSRDLAPPGSVQIQVVRLDDYVVEKAIERLDLIKIDVEGFEGYVLLGAREALRKFRPVLFMEFSDGHLRAAGHEPRWIIETLATLGYRVYHAEHGQELSAEDDFRGCHFDVICRPGQKFSAIH